MQTKRFIVLIVISLIAGLSVKLKVGEIFMSTIFNVSGIMFSLGLGLIVTFNLNGVKNKGYIKSIRENLLKVRNSFMLYFSIVVLCFVIDQVLRSNNMEVYEFIILSKSLNMNWSVFLLVLMLYSILYFIFNFLNIQKLNDAIFDEINK